MSRYFAVWVYLIGVVIGVLIGCAAERGNLPTPSPSPLPTPWLWTDEHGAGIYVCYSPCTLTNPFQAPPSAAP